MKNSELMDILEEDYNQNKSFVNLIFNTDSKKKHKNKQK